MDLNQILFGVYPYIALSVLVIGSVARFDREPYTWRSGSSQLLRRRQLVTGSVLFHLGVLMIFAGHFVGLLTPIAVFDALGVPHAAKQMLAIVAGGILLGQRTQGHERLAGVQPPHGAVDAGRLQALGRRERRQDRRQPCGQHRLSGSRRSGHQQIVPAGGCDLQCALCALLSLDVFQVERVLREFANLWRGPRQDLRAPQMIDELQERARRDDVHVGRGPCCLRAAGCGTDQTLIASVCRNGGRKHAGNRCQRTIKPEFADHHEAFRGIRWNRADRRHEAERDRQIVMTAFLRQVGGREIDGDALRRKREARSDQCGANALARLRNGLVGKAHNIECGKPGCDLHLYVNGSRLDAFECKS